MNVPCFDGWHFLGQFESGVASWLLAADKDALLLEVPEGLTVADVRRAVAESGATLRYVTASHDHWDHIDEGVWDALAAASPKVEFIHPKSVRDDYLLHLGGEPVWLIKAPKHSRTDVVTVFRGVAMTGDIELGTLESVNADVPLRTKRASMAWLRGFEARVGYHIHTTISAHLDDLRHGVVWAALFDV